MHFLGIKWDNKQKIPYIKYKDNSSDIAEKYLKLEQNKRLTITIEEEKYCIGFYEPLNYLRAPCNNISKIETEEYSQCNICRLKDSTYFLPLNVLNYEQIKLLKTQPHLNYINIFGKDIIKIGIAAKVRKFTRILEQGAIATIFFTDTDGYISRILESLLSKKLNIKQAVMWDTKIKNLRNISEDSDAYNELEKIYKQIKDIFPLEYQKSMLLQPEYYFNFNYYGIKISDNLSSIKLLNKFSSNDVISGVVIGIYGEIIFIKDNHSEDVYGTNTKSLLGYIITISDKDSSMKLKNEPKLIQFPTIQFEKLSLF